MCEKNNGGRKGKGHQETCIKDPWTNQRGVGLRVGDVVSGEGREVGGNLDNCT